MDSLIGGENWTIDPSQITDKIHVYDDKCSGILIYKRKIIKEQK
jgi:hypothetical protein